MADFGFPGTSLRCYFSVRKPGEQNFSLSDSPEPPRSEKHKNVQPNQGDSLRFVSSREELNGKTVFKLASYGQMVSAENFFLVDFFLTSFAVSSDVHGSVAFIMDLCTGECFQFWDLISVWLETLISVKGTFGHFFA